MELTRLCIAESLRKYPEPPLLIRRTTAEDTLPISTDGIGLRFFFQSLRGTAARFSARRSE